MATPTGNPSHAPHRTGSNRNDACWVGNLEWGTDPNVRQLTRTLGLLDSFENIFHNFTPVHVEKKGARRSAISPPAPPPPPVWVCVQKREPAAADILQLCVTFQLVLRSERGRVATVCFPPAAVTETAQSCRKYTRVKKVR